MTAGCCHDNKGVDGLSSGHAYTFLDVFDLKDSAGNVKHKLAKIRNPWSSEGYNGKWSD